MTRRTKLGCLAIFIAVTVPPCLGWYFFMQKPAKKFDRLLHGDTTITVQSFTISGQQESNKVIDDPEAVAYLTNAIRGANTRGHKPSRYGNFYAFTLHFAPLQGASTNIIIPGDQSQGFTLAQYEGGLFGDNIYYWVGFDEPVPESITRTFDQLRESEKKNEPPLHAPTTLPAPSSKSK